MKNYEKPFIVEEEIELEDIIAVSNGDGSVDDPMDLNPTDWM